MIVLKCIKPTSFLVVLHLQTVDFVQRHLNLDTTMPKDTDKQRWADEEEEEEVQVCKVLA
jgi:hypothetical protein